MAGRPAQARPSRSQRCYPLLGTKDLIYHKCGAGSGFTTWADLTLVIVTSGEPHATDLTVMISL
jgi:hypothetical protein